MTSVSPVAPSPHTGLFKRHVQPLSLFDRSLVVPAIWGAFRKLDPRTLVRNPVMFVVEIVSVLTTIFFLRDLFIGRSEERRVGKECIYRWSAYH